MKKNWKKVLLTITAVLMAAGLAGCGKGNATGNTAGQAEQQAESTKEQKNQSQDVYKRQLMHVPVLLKETRSTMICCMQQEQQDWISL